MQWNYAFDLGSETIRMVMRGPEGMYTEPGREALRPGQDAPFAKGEEAAGYEGRETGGITVKRITYRGLPVNVQNTARLVRGLVALHEKKIPGRKTALVSVSPFIDGNTTAVLLKAMLAEGLDAAGIVESDFASLTGNGVEIKPDSAYCVLDMGASMISCSVIVNSVRIKAASLPYGMDRFDSDIYESVMRNAHVIPGREAVRTLKHGVFETNEDTIKVPVFDTEAGLPRMRDIQRGMVIDILDRLADESARLCGEVMTNLPEGCASDILKNGVVITGGGSKIYGIDRVLKKKLGVPAVTGDNGDKCAINGLKMILENQEKYALLIGDWREAGMRA